MLPRIATLAIQAGSLTQCFYCAGKLPARKKEHIFNACWGGRHKTSQLICDECNAAFSAIDDALSSWTRFVMNAWQVKGQRQKNIPTIPLQGDYDLVPGSKPKLRQPLLDVRSEEGHHQVSLEASSKSEARRVLLDGELEKRIGRGLTVEERERFLAQVR
jgi:hypothetical protein